MPIFPDVSWTTASLEQYVFTSIRERIEAHPGPLYRLHIGDTWMEPVECARAESLSTALNPGLHRYAPVHGLPELIDAIGRKLQRRTGLSVARECIQVVAGATGGLSNVCQSLLDPGDEVLIPAPYWPLSRGIVDSRGAKAIQVPFYDRLDDPSFDPERALEQAITEKTCAIYLNSPNNPTGAILCDSVLDAIGRVAKRHDLWVFSDEVYEDIWYTDTPPAPIWTRPDFMDRTLAVHSMSKGYGLAGARIGYVHGPERVMRAVKAVQTFQNYCAAKPMQMAASRALDHGDEWLANARRLYKTAAEKAARILGIKPPSGGTFVFFDASIWLDESDKDVIPWLLRCLEAGVLLTPGSASGADYPRWARLCFTSIPPDELEKSLELLATVTN
jgi:N-succinyldiaminopimelate aminotransferase